MKSISNIKLVNVKRTRTIHHDFSFQRQLIRRNIRNRLCVKNITGSDIVFKKLIEHNVSDVFMISGGSIMSVVDKFYNQSIVNHYVPTNEQSMVYAAKGYASYSNKPGVCIATSGPGVTNCVTGLLDAKNDGVPLVLISGQVALNKMGTGAFQECSAKDITKPVTKWSYCVENINELPSVLDEAFKYSTMDRKGPVHIDIPKDILQSEYNNDYQYYCKYNFKYNKLNIDDMMIKFHEIAKMINKSKKPILLVGNGCRHATRFVQEFVRTTNIPITTTLHALGAVDESSDLSLKMLGMHGSMYANKAIQNSDCIIGIGVRFDDRITSNLDYYAPEAHKAGIEKRGGIIHCNIDEDELGKLVDSIYNVNCDSQTFLRELTNILTYKSRKAWHDELDKWKKYYPFRFTKFPNNVLTTQTVLDSLDTYIKNNKLFDKNLHISTGVGNHQMMACQFITWTKPNRIITSGSLGVMGVGLPYAIGAMIASKTNNEKIIMLDLDGDSSFNMTSGELKTIVQYNLPVKIMIFNDNSQSMVRTWEEDFFDGRITATTNDINPKYGSYDKVYPGLKSFKCDSFEDLDKSFEIIFNYNQGPVLCEYIVKSDKCLPMVPPNNALDDPIY